MIEKLGLLEGDKTKLAKVDFCVTVKLNLKEGKSFWRVLIIHTQPSLFLATFGPSVPISYKWVKIHFIKGEISFIKTFIQIFPLKLIITVTLLKFR